MASEANRYHTLDSTNAAGLSSIILARTGVYTIEVSPELWGLEVSIHLGASPSCLLLNGLDTENSPIDSSLLLEQELEPVLPQTQWFQLIPAEIFNHPQSTLSKLWRSYHLVPARKDTFLDVTSRFKCITTIPPQPVFSMNPTTPFNVSVAASESDIGMITAISRTYTPSPLQGRQPKTWYNLVTQYMPILYRPSSSCTLIKKIADNLDSIIFYNTQAVGYQLEWQTHHFKICQL